VVEVPTGNTYDKYRVRNPIERRLVERFLSQLDGSLPVRRPRRVLEVGTGEGVVSARVASRFPDAQVVGLDLPDRELALEWGERGLCGVFGDSHRLPFDSGSFDLILAIEVLEHVSQPTVALAEIARVASSHVVLSVPREPLWRLGNMARGRYLRAFGNTPGHINHWGRDRFVRLVDNHLAVEAVVNPLPWTMVVARSRHPS
jgi:ubiquinone/menaquinone biosynthesis C-methylase UbiE